MPAVTGLNIVLKRASGVQHHKIVLKNVNGNMEKSSFSDLSLQFDLNKTSDLEVKSGKSALHMDEIFPWLSSFDSLKPKMKALKTVKGVVSMSALCVYV